APAGTRRPHRGGAVSAGLRLQDCGRHLPPALRRPEGAADGGDRLHLPEPDPDGLVLGGLGTDRRRLAADLSRRGAAAAKPRGGLITTGSRAACAASCPPLGMLPSWP